MKHVQLIGLIVCATFFASCETTTETAGNPNVRGNAEAKRLAALEQRRQQEAQMDEGQKSLWNAEQDILNRDGNPNAGR